MKTKRAESRDADQAPKRSRDSGGPPKDVGAHQTESILQEIHRRLQKASFAVDYISQAARQGDEAALRRAVEDLVTAFTIDFSSVRLSEPKQFAELPKTYGGLCRLLLPRPVHTQAEREKMGRIAELMGGHELTAEQKDYFDLLCNLVERHKEQKGSIPCDPEIWREAERIGNVQTATPQKRLWKLARKLPSDSEPYGQRSRGADYGPDCSCGCKFFHPLERETDWGICTNSKSPRAGLLTFEHMGCKKFKAA